MVKDIVIFADASNFMLTLDGIGTFLQNFKTLELLKIEKFLIHLILLISTLYDVGNMSH